MKLYAVILIGFCSLNSTWSAAQRNVNLDSVGDDFSALRNFYTVGGQPVNNTKFTRLVSGTPFVRAEWRPVTLVLANGGRIQNIQVRLNLISNEIHYLKDNVELVSDKQVKEVVFSESLDGMDRVFRNGYPESPLTSKATYFEVLCDGRVQLLKFIRKVLTEQKPYSSATTEQTIRESESYYLFKDGQLHRIKNGKSDLLALLEDQQKMLSQMIDKNELNLRKEEDLMQVVHFYNRIPEEK